jgi:hypothetical protein
MASTEVRGPVGAGRIPAVLLSGIVLASTALPLLAAEVYGKPLRGLTAVAVREAVADPGRFAGRDIRVAGPNTGPAGRPELKDGDAVLPILTDGSFKLPEKLEGSQLAAEGRLKRDGPIVVFVATGVEVRR